MDKLRPFSWGQNERSSQNFLIVNHPPIIADRILDVINVAIKTSRFPADSLPLLHFRRIRVLLG